MVKDTDPQAPSDNDGRSPGEGPERAPDGTIIKSGWRAASRPRRKEAIQSKSRWKPSGSAATRDGTGKDFPSQAMANGSETPSPIGGDQIRGNGQSAARAEKV